MSASAGRVLIMPKGTYNPNTPYVLLDAVFYNGNSYIAKGDTLGNLPTDSEHWQILAQGAGVISGAFVGACDSLGSAQVKSVIIPPADNFALQKGVIVGVRFTNTNTFEATAENSIALNVNSTGALPIYFGGTATPLGSNVVAFGEAGYTHFYQYDGTNWVFIGRSGVQTAEQTPLETPISVGGVSKANVEETLGALNTKESNEVAAIVNVYGSKNLNSYPYYETTKSANGITFTVNNNGSVHVGDSEAQTATGVASFVMHRNYASDANSCYLKNGTYKLSGTPSGGGQGLYYSKVYWRDTNNNWVTAYDYGDGATFVINDSYQNEGGAYVYVEIDVESGVTIPAGGVTFSSMIRDARISDDTYVPYAMTNRELTEDIKKIFDLNSDATCNINGKIHASGKTAVLYIHSPKTAMTAGTEYDGGILPVTIPGEIYTVLSGNARTYRINIKTTGRIYINTNDTLPATGIPYLFITIPLCLS